MLKTSSFCILNRIHFDDASAAGESDASFARACGEYARNDAFRSLNETVIANVGRDRDKGAMFARVPTGFETCTFCLMLAGTIGSTTLDVAWQTASMVALVIVREGLGV